MEPEENPQEKNAEEITVFVEVAKPVSLAMGTVFRMLDESIAKKRIDARAQWIAPLELVDVIDPETGKAEYEIDPKTKKPAIDEHGRKIRKQTGNPLGRWRVVDMHGAVFKAGELLELTFKRGALKKAFFRQFFALLPDQADPFPRKVAKPIEELIKSAAKVVKVAGVENPSNEAAKVLGAADGHEDAGAGEAPNEAAAAPEEEQPEAPAEEPTGPAAIEELLLEAENSNEVGEAAAAPEEEQQEEAADAPHKRRGRRKRDA